MVYAVCTQKLYKFTTNSQNTEGRQLNAKVCDTWYVTPLLVARFPVINMTSPSLSDVPSPDDTATLREW